MARRVRDLLRSRPVDIQGIQQAASVLDAAAAFLDKDTSALAVYDGERLAGIFTKNDLVRCCGARSGDVSKARISDTMKTGIFTTTPDADLDDVMAVMVEKGFHHVPVLDGERAIGMLSSGDILTHQNHMLHVDRSELMRYVQGSY